MKLNKISLLSFLMLGACTLLTQFISAFTIKNEKTEPILVIIHYIDAFNFSSDIIDVAPMTTRKIQPHRNDARIVKELEIVKGSFTNFKPTYTTSRGITIRHSAVIEPRDQKDVIGKIAAPKLSETYVVKDSGVTKL